MSWISLQLPEAPDSIAPHLSIRLDLCCRYSPHRLRQIEQYRSQKFPRCPMHAASLASHSWPCRAELTMHAAAALLEAAYQSSCCLVVLLLLAEDAVCERRLMPNLPGRQHSSMLEVVHLWLSVGAAA